MEFCSYEDLNASFSFEEQIFIGDNALDHLCQTYLGNMASFAESYTPEAPANSVGLLDQIEAFARTDISLWTPEDCLDWAGSICRKRGIDQSTVDLWSFRSHTGSDLLQFTSQDFSNLVGSIYGPVFHGEFTDLRHKREQGKMFGAVGGTAPVSSSSSSSLVPHHQVAASSSPYDYPGSEAGYDSDPLELTYEDIQELDRYIHHPDYDPMSSGVGPGGHGGPLGDDLSLPEQFMPIKLEEQQYIPESVMHTTTTSSSAEDASSASGQEHLQKLRPDAKKRPRGPKNWEFVIRLLADPKTNPSLIRWEDQSQATFRLVQPTTIAKMWGQRSNKPNLTYDNFARGLRYHYTTGALQAVSEKQLVYRCGPKALKYLIDLKKEGLMQPPSS
ncbi:transcriptional regulator ERG-like isoform X1 [Macrobrachium nipponense]|uniref:transcriptional regulator ERG-like isoform X1 n=2 Tax=Macrobrachium nipponense TaxID=159736 RepID=UPI0030C87FF7